MYYLNKYIYINEKCYSIPNHFKNYVYKFHAFYVLHLGNLRITFRLKVLMQTYQCIFIKCPF